MLSLTANVTCVWGAHDSLSPLTSKMLISTDSFVKCLHCPPVQSGRVSSTLAARLLILTAVPTLLGRTYKLWGGGWRSPRLELCRFPLLLHEAQWFLKHKHFSDHFVSLVDFQRLCLSGLPAVWSHLGERICPILSQSHS